METITSTAKQRYTDRKEEVQRLLGNLSEDVAAHARRFRGQGQSDWGFVGDLAHVAELLQQAHNFLNNIDEE